MKEGWEYKRIKDIGTVIAGTTPNTNIAEYWDGNLCWISPAELDGSHYLYDSRKKITEAAVKAKSLRLLPEGTVILSSRAPIGKVVINKVPTYCNQGFKCVVCDKEVYNEFLYWWFWGKTEFLNSLGTGATFKEISKKVVEEILIPVPPLSEQQSIVDYLDSAFAKIDAMKANAEKALNEAKALFQASLKEMLEPKEGWEEKALKDFATDMYRGSGVKRDQVTEEGISCVRYGEIYTKYNFHFSKCASHTLAEYVNSPKYFEYGDILFAITGESVEEIGKSIAYTGKEKCIAGGDIVVMKHNYEPRYISYALSTPSAIKQKGHGKTKLKVVHTNIPSLKEIILPIAPKDEQIKISDTLDSLKSKVDRLQENYNKISQECDALKQAILRQVFE